MHKRIIYRGGKGYIWMIFMGALTHETRRKAEGKEYEWEGRK